MRMRTFTHLLTLPTFKERYEYLKLDGKVGKDTFGEYRYLNQQFYTSYAWLRFRDRIIIRDSGCDLGIPGMEIYGPIHVHHLNPLTIDDFLNQSSSLLDENNVICCSESTHKAITYGSEFLLLPTAFEERTANDTCLWKRKEVQNGKYSYLDSKVNGMR